jgi:6-phosphogluconate dehydrogenase
MVHNGIEYGLMQAFGEGFDILRNVNSPAVPENRRYKLDLADVAEVWRRGSVVSSWLLDLTAIALAEDPDLREFSAGPSRSVQNTAAPSRASASAAAPPMPPPAPAISATLPATRPMPPSCHAVESTIRRARWGSARQKTIVADYSLPPTNTCFAAASSSSFSLLTFGY